MLNFILCDDKKQHNIYMKKRLEKIIKTHKLDAKVAFYSNDPLDILKYSQIHKNDFCNVYVLDIDFEDKMNGVELARKIRDNEANAYIIFVSAHQEYSMLCYKVKTFDFLLKPVNYDILEKCILALVKDFYSVYEKKDEQFITIKTTSEIHKIPIDDIYYCEKYGKILVIHTKKGVFRTYTTIKEIQKKLENYGFFRCHKSYLINLKYISHISINENAVYMVNGGKCFVSRSYRKELLDRVINNS